MKLDTEEKSLLKGILGELKNIRSSSRTKAFQGFARNTFSSLGKMRTNAKKHDGMVFNAKAIRKGVNNMLGIGRKNPLC